MDVPNTKEFIIIIIIIIIIITAIAFSLYGRSPNTSTGKTNKNKYT
jgi:flagellar basal body-associated protein FliL